MNGRLGTEPLHGKLCCHPVTHHVSLGEEPDTPKTIGERIDFELLGAFDVFNNCQNGRRVPVYRLTPRRDRTPCGS